MSLKILELENEQALDALADIIEPLNEIWTDEELAKIANGDGNSNTKGLKIIRRIIKEHKQAIMQIVAALDGVDVKDVKVNIISLVARMNELKTFIFTSGLSDLFYSQVQMTE